MTPSRDAGPTGSTSNVSPLQRRQRRLMVLAVAAAVLSTSGLFASLVIKSPQQLAAESQPPPATVLTAVVERRVLRDTVVLRGKVEPQSTLAVTPSPREGGRAVVTAVRALVGGTVGAGEVIIEVSGRPLVAMVGAIPAYRDLRPGTNGKDVAQVQAALRALGYRVGDPVGFFGEGTKRAVTDFYDDRGYPVPTTGDDDARAVEAAARQVKQAERTVADARRALADARAESASPTPPSGAARRVADAEAAVARAEEDLALTRADLAALRKRSGPMVPLAELVFVPAVPARVEKLSSAVGAEVVAPLVTLASGAPSIRAHLNPAQRELVKPGMEVTVTADLLGMTAQATIATIGELAQDEALGRGYPTLVSPMSTLDARLIGQDVRLAVERARTDGEVIVVPLAAVTATADGQAIVVKRTADGREERVPVTPGTSGDGFVAVTPISGVLAPGDRVVVSG